MSTNKYFFLYLAFEGTTNTVTIDNTDINIKKKTFFNFIFRSIYNIDYSQSSVYLCFFVLITVSMSFSYRVRYSDLCVGKTTGNALSFWKRCCFSLISLGFYVVFLNAAHDAGLATEEAGLPAYLWKLKQGVDQSCLPVHPGRASSEQLEQRIQQRQQSVDHSL